MKRRSSWLGFAATMVAAGCGGNETAEETNALDQSPTAGASSSPSSGSDPNNSSAMSTQTSSPVAPTPEAPGAMGPASGIGQPSESGAPSATSTPTTPGNDGPSTGGVQEVPEPNPQPEPATTPTGEGGTGPIEEPSNGGAANVGGSEQAGGSGNDGGNANVAGAPSGAGTFHVFLLLGQSNMAGYPKAQEEDREEDPRVRVLGFDDCSRTGRQTDQWDIASPPLHECFNDGVGPGDYFAKTVIDVLPEGDTIGLVPCAISGERIETFMKEGGTEYEWILGRARMALDEGGVIDGILFHQGESNSGDSSWPGKVSTLITDLRTDLGIGDVPFLAGELLYSGGTAGHNTLVNQLPEALGNAFVVSAEGLVVDPSDTQWNLHFSRESQITFGQRYAETMLEALGW